MQTMLEAIAQLRRQGYKHDFTLEELRQFDPEQFGHDYVVDQTYRFDELSDPEDQSTLYAVSSRDGRTHGILVNGYGLYSDPVVTGLLDHLEARRNERN